MIPKYATMLVEDLLKSSPPVALLMCLIIISRALLGIKFFNNDYIPLFLCITGTVVYPFIGDRSAVSYNIPYPWVMNAVLGGGMGGIAAVVFSSTKDMKLSNLFKKKDSINEH